METNYHYPRLKKRGIQWGRVAALIIVLLMMMADVYTMRDLYIEVGNDWIDAWIYAFVAAIILEGMPAYLGIALSEKHDKGRFNVNDEYVNKKGIPFAVLVLVLTWAVVIMLRVKWIETGYEIGRYGGRHSEEEVIGQYFLVCSPVLTSLASGAVSWFALRSSYLQKKYQEVYRLQEKFQRAEQEFLIAHQRCREARTSVWTSLCGPDVTDMPKSFENFRLECFARIRAKMVDNCLIAYPTQIERYTSMVEAKLGLFLQEASQHSTIPYAINRNTIQDIITKYDLDTMDNADCWNYNMSGPDLEAELRRTIDNAVIVAQYKTALMPYYLDKER